jgi:hypothetical protein
MYGLVIVSGGLFAFPWVLLILRDINRYERKPIFRVRFLAFLFLLALALYFLFIFGPLIFQKPEWRINVAALVVLGVGLNLLLFSLLAKASVYVDEALGASFKFTRAAILIVLTFVAALSLVVLQRRLNLLIARMG